MRIIITLLPIYRRRTAKDGSGLRGQSDSAQASNFRNLNWIFIFFFLSNSRRGKKESNYEKQDEQRPATYVCHICQNAKCVLCLNGIAKVSEQVSQRFIWQTASPRQRKANKVHVDINMKTSPIKDPLRFIKTKRKWHWSDVWIK